MPNGIVVPLGQLAITGGIELVKFFAMLALQEAKRSKMTPEQTKEALAVAKAEFEKNDPDLIPDV